MFGRKKAEPKEIPIYMEDRLPEGRKYEVIGTLVHRGGGARSEKFIQKKVQEDARKMGADAVINARRGFIPAFQGTAVRFVD